MSMIPLITIRNDNKLHANSIRQIKNKLYTYESNKNDSAKKEA